MSRPVTGIRWVSREQIETPHHGYGVMMDCWWPVNANGDVALYFKAGRGPYPQCNLQKRAAEIVGAKSLPDMVDVVQIPLAYVAQHCGDIPRYFEDEPSTPAAEDD